MLHYLGTGTRHYRRRPIPMGIRRLWEFQAIFNGRARMVLPGGSRMPEGDCLYLIRPDCAHGWDGDGDTTCEVCVFQYPSIPPELASLIGQRPYISIPLQPDLRAALARCATLARNQIDRPTACSALAFEHILLELSLMLLQAREQSHVDGAYDYARTVVDSAMQWFRDHLQRHPSLADVARAVSVSPSHLRRLFHQTHGSSPQESLEHIRFQHALRLMHDDSLTLQAVAEAAGFASTNGFTRAFRRRFGDNPSTWRTRQTLHRSGPEE